MGSVTVLVTLASLTWRQAHVYRDAETLWLDTLAKNPDCWMADHNLANLFLQRGDVLDAVAHWEHALQANPDLPEVYNNLALSYEGIGRQRDASRAYELAKKSLWVISRCEKPLQIIALAYLLVALVGSFLVRLP